MNRRTTVLKRIISFVIIFSMFIPILQFPVSAVSTDGTKKRSGEIVEGTNELNEWIVQAVWSENKEQTISKYETENKSVGIKLTFSFFLNGARRAYEAEEVRFKVRGISDIGRTGPTSRAETTTTQSESDWKLEYDESKDEYTFIYKKPIPKSQEMSGGFQMQWSFPTRQAWDGYVYSSNPVFSVGDESINMPPLTLEYGSKRDLYSIALGHERLTALELEDVKRKFERDYPPLEGEEPKDYLWYKYNNTLSRQTYARGMNKWSYFVAFDIEKDEEFASNPENVYKEMTTDDLTVYMWTTQNGQKVLKELSIESIQDPATGQEVYGFWMFKDKYGDPEWNYQFIMGMDKDKTDGNYVHIETRLIPLFNDETEAILDNEAYLTNEGGHLTAEYVGTNENYFFIYDHYDFWHSKKLANSAYDNGERLANEYYNGRTDRFVLAGSTNRGYKSGSKSPKASGDGEDPYDDPDYVDRVYPQISEPFSFIMGDDKVFVRTRIGKLRELEEDEYNIKAVYVRPNTYYDSYEFDIYITYTQGQSPSEYIYYASGETNDLLRGYVKLPDGVKGFYAEVKNVVGTYSCSVDVDVDFKFDWEKEKQKEYNDQIDPDGSITNVSYMRLVKADGHNFASMPLSHYGGVFRTLLAPYDREKFGEYIYREFQDLSLRTPRTYLDSETYISAFKKEAGSAVYNSYIQSTGTISADEDGPLKKFSVYTVIPKDVLFDRNLGNIEFVQDGSHVLRATGTDGYVLDESDFKDHVSYSIRQDEIGRYVVTADFDFSDMPIEISTGAKLTIKIPVYITVADYAADVTAVYTAESFTAIHDDGIEKIHGSKTQTDLTDIDNDGDKAEIVAHSNSSTRFTVLLKEWIESSTKFVKTEYSGSYVYGEPEEHVRADYKTGIESQDKESYYSYRLDFEIGENPIKDIVFYDAIEPKNVSVFYNSEDIREVNSSWQGTLQSVDISSLLDAGFIGSKVYYLETQIDLEQDGFKDLHAVDNSEYHWKEMTSDSEGRIWRPAQGDTVRTIAVKLPTEEKEELSRMISVKVNMQTPVRTDGSFDNTAAQNYFVVTCTQRQAGLSTYLNSEYKSAVTNVYIQETTPVINIKKVDKTNHAALPGAKFGVYRDAECTQPVIDEGKGIDLTEITTNNLGIAAAPVPSVGTYYLKELQAPNGYVLNDEVKEITATKTTEVITVEAENERITGSVHLLKKDLDNTAVENIPGAKFELYTANDEKVYTDANYHYMTGSAGTNTTFVTGEDGLTITGLPWGNYYFKETEAPKGYALNENKTPFAVRKKEAENGTINVTVEHYDEELTASLRIIKTDAEDDGLYLRGARYNVEKKSGDDWIVVRNNVATNAVGELTVEGLKFGEYRFKEMIAPKGYDISNTTNPKTVTLTADTVGETFEVRQSDSKKTGSVQLTKVSNTGVPISGAVFSLYKLNGEKDANENRPDGDPSDDLIRSSIKTDHKGLTEVIDGLDWGSYYFVETKAAKGYSKTDVRYTSELITITPDNVDITQEVTASNNQIPGTVTLTKYKSEDRLKENKEPLAGAMFSLYDKDDNLIAAGLYRGTYDVKTGITTGEEVPNGKLTVKNLPWGSYYFKETKAPDGYTVSDVVRFAVNAQNCMSEQQLECYDDPITCEITIEKEIDDALPQFGNPTFLFKITNTGTGKTWTEALTLNSEKKSDTVKINVERGTYTVEEIGVSRYKLYDMRVAVSGDNTLDQNVAVDVNETEKKFTFTLDASGDRGDSVHLIFENHLESYDKDNHVTAARNIIPIEKKITGISVEYLKDYIPLNSSAEDSEYTINKAEELQLTLIYDDGSTVTVDPSKFGTLLPKGGVGDFKVSNGVNDESNEVSVNAQYTVDGKTYYTTFFVTVAPAVVKPTQKVIYMVDDNNESYFDKNGKHPTANVVTYVGGEVKSGEYIEVIPLAEDMKLVAWKDNSGNEFNNETELLSYLEEHPEINLITVTAVLDYIDLVTEIPYSGAEYKYEVPVSGYYKLEVWGASGGDGAQGTAYYGKLTMNSHAGHGGYSVGYKFFNKGDILYVYVGGKGLKNGPSTSKGGWNGGGNASSGWDCGGGGGMTHITTTPNNAAVLNQTWNPSGTLIVAGGGGGADNWHGTGAGSTDGHGYSGDDGSGGHGGGLEGTSAIIDGYVSTGYAGTQSAGYLQGIGQTGTNNDAGGGGGGWYGGKSTNHNNGGGGGGSGYIDSSLINAETIVGNQTVPYHNGALCVEEGATEMTGNLGDGYSVITFVGRSLPND